MSDKNFDWLLNTPIAHRGLHDETNPENSMPAFKAAIERGFHIEIDVHLSKDNQLVVFHDANLKRVCGVDRKVKDCTSISIWKPRSIAALKAGILFSGLVSS